MSETKKFLHTREFLEQQDTPEAKTLAVLSGIPLVTAALYAPETVVSVAEDICAGIGKAWGSIFD